MPQQELLKLVIERLDEAGIEYMVTGSLASSLQGEHIEQPAGAVRFRWVSAPTSAELTELVQRMAQRSGRYLERQGLLQRDAQSSYLAGERIDEGPMEPLWGPRHHLAHRRRAASRAQGADAANIAGG